MHLPTKRILKISTYIVILIILIGGALSVNKKVEAQAEVTSVRNVDGWAWSDGTGWISFNCITTMNCAQSDYGVSVATSTDQQPGVISGYAWSDNYGWLSFNTDDISCPDGGACTPIVNLTSGAINGYARFCAATVNGDCTGADATNTGGWDGWLKLSDDTFAPSPVPDGTRGLTYDGINHKIVGYSWGGEGVGWLKFDTAYHGGVNVHIDDTVVKCFIDTTPYDPGTVITRYSTNHGTSTAACNAHKYTDTCTLAGDGNSANWSTNITPIENNSYPYGVCDISISTSCTIDSDPCVIPNSKGTQFGTGNANGTLTCGRSLKFYASSTVYNNATGNLTCDSNANSEVRTCNGDTGVFSGLAKYQRPVCHVNPYQKEK